MPIEPITFDAATTAAEAALGADSLLIDGQVVMVYVRVKVRDASGEVVERECLWGATDESDRAWMQR